MGGTETPGKTNVMVVINGLGIGGAEIVVRDLAETIDRERFTFSICCLRVLGTIGEELEAGGADVFVLPQREDGRVDYLSALKLRRAIRARGVQVLHSHTTHAMMDATLCKLLQPSLKVMHTFHFGNYPHLPPRTQWMERFCSRIVDRLVAVGEDQRQRIASAYGLNEGRMQVVWNGVRPCRPGDPRAFRERIGVGDRFLVGTIATLIEQKGLRDLLAVARRCHDQNPEMRFVLVGEGHLRSELERLRRELGLEEIVILTGWVPSAADQALPAFDVFFQPSHWEAMSIAILEAMAAGKPIVATRVGDNARVLDDGVNGVIVETRDVDGMSAALLHLAADRPERIRLGAAARDKFGARFTLDHMTRTYEALYRGLAGAAA